MFLQNLYNWKPFRAVAALMLVLFMATACQETAQQVIQKSTSAPPIAETKSANRDNVAAQSILSLTEVEKAFMKKIEGDKDVAAMNKIQKTLILKMKIAIGHDKEGFKQAILNKDGKKFLELMNFSASEYAEFSTKFQEHLSNFEKRYNDDVKTIANLKKRYAEQYKNSKGASTSLDANALEEQLAIIEKANIVGMDNIQVFDEEECRRARPEIWAQYNQNRININLGFLLGFPIAAAGGPIALGLFLAGTIAATIINECSTCGC
jgi:hypothetical protein